MSRPIRWPLVIIVTLFAGLATLGFASLGVWQIHRLHWKVELIRQVDTRVNARPVAAPGPQVWSDITRDGDEYTHVTLHGTFLNDDEVQVYTPSDFGPGYWVLTPLKRDDGSIVMINRGVVPQAFRDPATRIAPTGEQTVTGLLRITESKGWLFSQKNRPEDDAWYRRDIAAITAAKGLSDAAPYFVDQEKLSADSWPRGGQTVVSFRNAHLSYAITWGVLALMVLAGYALFLWQELVLRHRKGDA